MSLEQMTLSKVEDLQIDEINLPEFEHTIRIRDPLSGLDALICIHNTTLGPSLGGIRIYPYTSFDDAFEDAKRLAKGMTYKAVMAQTETGGGKAVIMCDPKKITPEMLHAFALAVHSLKGSYICAEDMGSTTAMMEQIARTTPYVVGLATSRSSGDPSRFTAWGCYRGIEAVMQTLDGDRSVAGKTFAIQGLGSVGLKLAEMLFWHGARLIVYDIDTSKMELARQLFGAEISSAEEILFTPCDVLVPAARGAILNQKSIPLLRCRAIAGPANNQLLTEEDGARIQARGILYTPDFVINAGGLINVVEELQPEGYHSCNARERVDALYDQLIAIFAYAKSHGLTPEKAAIALADERLRTLAGKRVVPVCLHHAQHIYHWNR